MLYARCSIILSQMHALEQSVCVCARARREVSKKEKDVWGNERGPDITLLIMNSVCVSDASSSFNAAYFFSPNDFCRRYWAVYTLCVSNTHTHDKCIGKPFVIVVSDGANELPLSLHSRIFIYRYILLACVVVVVFLINIFARWFLLELSTRPETRY